MQNVLLFSTVEKIECRYRAQIDCNISIEEFNAWFAPTIKKTLSTKEAVENRVNISFVQVTYESPVMQKSETLST